MSDRGELPSLVVKFLTDLYGELPPLRLDSPLSALNFRPSDAAVIAHWAWEAGASQDTCRYGDDSAFLNIQTINDLIIALDIPVSEPQPQEKV